MSASTTPDGIVSATTGDSVTIAAATTALANSVQTALALRQRYEFVWANAAARTNQAGMVVGAVGYQIDTKTEYIYESSTWRLKTPHAEYTVASKSMPNATLTTLGAFSQDASNTTSSTFTTYSGTDGGITVIDPGIYAFSTLTNTGVAATGRTFVDIAQSAADANPYVRNSMQAGESVISNTLPNVRQAASNVTYWFVGFQTSGSTGSASTRVRITRLG